MDQRSKIAILGFGLEGKATMKYLLKHGYSELTVCDSNVNLDFKMPEGVSVSLGESYMEDLSDFDVVFRSPGIPYLSPEIQLAKDRGVEILSGTGFFMDQCPCDVVGVTGTKGKGTTSTLIYEMLKKGDKKVYLGGNIGKPAMDFLDDLEGDDLVVLEMSSFQLQDLVKSPKYSVVLNTTSEHLDHHADTEEYLAAKESILAHQHEGDVAVLNRDYAYVEQFENLVKGELRLVSREHKVVDGAFVESGGIYHVVYEDAEHICDVDEVALIGSHNLENVLPAVVIAKELGISSANIAEVISEFKGLPNRLEFVGGNEEVKFYNDSFSTTPDTSIAAVEAFEEDMILIAGGSDKGADYTEWAQKISMRSNLLAVVLIGEMADKMQKNLEDVEDGNVEIMRATDLEEAVKMAFDKLKAGVVVMSPACASFDMFENYKKRGEAFRSIVKSL